jgi:hypothetical protein
VGTDGGEPTEARGPPPEEAAAPATITQSPSASADRDVLVVAVKRVAEPKTTLAGPLVC